MKTLVIAAALLSFVASAGHAACDDKL